MQHPFLRLFLVVAVVLTLGQSTAWADTTETANFSYHWSFKPDTIINGSGNFGQVIVSVDESVKTDSYVMAPGTPATPIIGANISTLVSDTSSFNNTSFSLTLHLKEGANEDFLTFSGNLNGTFTKLPNGDVISTVTGTWSKPFQTLLLGDHLYEVTIDPKQVGIPLPNASSTTSLGALIEVKNKNGGVGGGTGGGTGGGGTGGGGTGGGGTGTSGNAPEPSTLVLGGLAAVGVMARRWSRRKRQVS